MKLDIITPTYYHSREPIKYLYASAIRNGIVLDGYGFSKPYTNWIQTHITDCLEKLYQTYESHVLFTDASDVIFLKSKQEIINRYLRLGHPPMLVSKEHGGMNAGGWMGEREVAIAILEYLKTVDIPTGGDPQERWRYAYSKYAINFEMDHMDRIFSVNRFPTDACLLHLAGGYSDPVTGRTERIKPIWEKLGYEPVQ